MAPPVMDAPSNSEVGLQSNTSTMKSPEGKKSSRLHRMGKKSQRFLFTPVLGGCAAWANNRLVIVKKLGKI